MSSEFPKTFQNDLDRAIKILRSAGCREIYLFGSVAKNRPRENSDLDFAVRGCPDGKFFGVLGELLCELEHEVDLINLDWQDDFAEFLLTHGELRRVF